MKPVSCESHKHNHKESVPTVVSELLPESVHPSKGVAQSHVRRKVQCTASINRQTRIINTLRCSDRLGTLSSVRGIQVLVTS